MTFDVSIDRVLLAHAARAEGIDIRVLRRDAQKGRLALIRIGGRDFVSLAELKRYLTPTTRVAVAA